MSADTHTHSPGGSAALHDRLAASGIDHEIIKHAATYSAGAEAEAVGVPGSRVAKTVVAVDHDRCWLAVIPASRRLDLRRFRARVRGSRHLRLATEEEISRRFTEFDVGATPPLGRLIGVSEVIDPLLLAHDSVVCPAGDHDHAVRLSTRALVVAADPDVADICVHLTEGRRTRLPRSRSHDLHTGQGDDADVHRAPRPARKACGAGSAGPRVAAADHLGDGGAGRPTPVADGRGAGGPTLRSPEVSGWRDRPASR